MNEDFLSFNESYEDIIIPKVLAEPIFDKIYVLEEDKHKDVNIGQAALGYMKKNLKNIPTLLDFDELIIRILKTWKYYDDFCINCRNTKLFLLQTYFNKPKHAANYIFNLNKNLDFKKLKDELKVSMAGTKGLFKQIENDSFIILIDENSKDDYNLIQHEFTHYVQIVTRKMISSLKENIPEYILNYFSLRKDLIKYIFNEYEFKANIFNEVFNGLQKIYWKKFKSLSWVDFIDHIFDQMKINPSQFRNSELFKYWLIENRTELYPNVLSCICYLNEDIFDKIKEELKNK